MFPVQLLSACIMVEQLFFFTKKPRVLRYIVVFMNKYGTNISEYRILLGIYSCNSFPAIFCQLPQKIVKLMTERNRKLELLVSSLPKEKKGRILNNFLSLFRPGTFQV